MFAAAYRQQATVFFALGLALYWVLLCWGVFVSGPWAMGFNYVLFVLGIALLFSIHAGEKRFDARHWPWIIPILLLALSYGLYENPFIKAVNVVVLPPLFCCYRIAVTTPHYDKIAWEGSWIEHLIRRFFGALAGIGTAIETIARTIVPFEARHAKTFHKVMVGLAIFIVLAAFIFVPLLSSADPAFARMMQSVIDAVWNVLSITGVFRTLFFIALSVALVAMTLRWNQSHAFSGKDQRSMIDDVISGVVLGGVLLLYVLFLLSQMSSLWVNVLPTEFSETEALVKSGFWQLFALSAINVLMFFVYYRRTKPAVQKILTVFTFASLLLLLSAAQRMVLYVWFYGLSYEKFFALYTVLFALVLFVYLIGCLFQRERRDIMKFLVYAFVWMYAVAAVLPTEQFIFRANSWLSDRPGSRIDMAELQMLSADVYGLVKEENQARPAPHWAEWLDYQAQISKAKAWYEWNAQDVKLRMIESSL